MLERIPPPGELRELKEPPSTANYVREFYLRRLVEEEKRLNAPGGVSDKERDKIIAVLDKDWEFMDKIMRVTGHVASSTAGLDDEKDDDSDVLVRQTEPVKIWVENIPFRSNGFLVEEEPEYVAGMHIGDKLRIKHVFTRPVTIYEPSGKEHNIMLPATAGIDDVHIEYLEEPLEQIKLYVEHHFPNEYAEIDRILEEAETEIMVLEMLGAIEYTAKQVEDSELDKAYLSEYLNPADYMKLAEYINRYLRYDSVPYLMEISESTAYLQFEKGAWVARYISGGTQIIVTPKSIRIEPEIQLVGNDDQTTATAVRNTHTLHYSLVVDVSASDEFNDMKDVSIPLAKVGDLLRIRDMVYNGGIATEDESS